MSRLSREHPDDPESWQHPVVHPPTTPRRCRCSHPESMHYRDRKDRATCGSAACGCNEWRPAP